MSPDFWKVLADIATAVGLPLGLIGLAVAAYHIYQIKKLDKVKFEDGFDAEYRRIVEKIPVNALTGHIIMDVHAREEAREHIYNYFDLCNTQIYLVKTRRISQERWELWKSGIEQNLEKPAFKDVWEEVEEDDPDTFSYLRMLREGYYEGDPRHWP